MSKPARRRASKTSALFVIAALLFVAGMAGSTFAYFDGSGANTGTFPGGYVFPPVTVTTLGAVTGPVQTIKWAQLTTTGVNNYELRVTNMGTTTAACPTTTVLVTLPTSTMSSAQSRTATLTGTVNGTTNSVTTIAAPVATTLTTTVSNTTPTTTVSAVSTVTRPVTYPETAATLAAPALTAPATLPADDNGYFVCYQAASAYSIGGWYSPPVNANATAARAGLWPTALAKAGTGGKLVSGDSITITYNQNVTATGSVTVCAYPSSGVIVFGDQTGCTNASATNYSVGVLSGLTFATAAQYTGTLTNAAVNKAKITLSGGPAAFNVTGGTAWTNGGSAITSVGTPSLGPCTQASCNLSGAAVTGNL